MSRFVSLRCLAAALLALCVGCGDDAPRPHAADGHTHDGAAGHTHEHGGAHGHTHDHGDDPPPEQVPIVRFEEETGRGPHGGIVVRLSSVDEPDAGFVEVKLGSDDWLELWLTRDQAGTKPLDVWVGTDGHLDLFERKDVSAVVTGRSQGRGTNETNHFASRLRWTPKQGELVRLRFEIEGKVLVSDDFELRPVSSGDGSK